jgi:tRNA-2-methylthio-N6-dimethylallyladenosine synthase
LCYDSNPIVKRVFVKTYGCQMNVHDSRRIEEVLGMAGWVATDRPHDADLVVFNTCSVREKAEHKLRSDLGRLRELRDERPAMVVALAGCMAQEHGEGLLTELDLVDVLVGPDNIAELPALVREAEGGAPPVARATHDVADPRFLRATPRPGAPEVSTYVTVMKGCDERCTFCIVPHTRGPERYRPADDIVGEIRNLVAGGVREVTLLGQTVNSWFDPSVPGDGGESRFPELLRRIAREVPELARLRYTSPHPRHVTHALVRAHADIDVLPWHVHLPVQSGSDRVLKRMLRRYRREDYLARARALQAARPGFTLSTDVIVGFPGEAEDDFLRTLSLVEEVGFVAVFAFKYSPRPHTPALQLGDDVPESAKEERLARLFEVVDRLQGAHLARLVGSRTRVLVERQGREGRWYGRSERHEIVHTEAPARADLTGALVEVRITEAHKRSLAAVLEGATPAARRIARGAAASVRLPVVA